MVGASNEACISLSLQLSSGADAEPEEIDLLARQLLNEVGELDVTSVKLVGEADAPEGAKAVDAATIGALAVEILPAVLPHVFDFLQSWLARRRDPAVKIRAEVDGRTVELECPTDGMSGEELKGLVDSFVRGLSR